MDAYNSRAYNPPTQNYTPTMALTIYRSNQVEMLQARLVERLAEYPLDDPFATEVVVVPTYAMARWLNLNLARQQGIAANIHYPQLAEWIWPAWMARREG